MSKNIHRRREEERKKIETHAVSKKIRHEKKIATKFSSQFIHFDDDDKLFFFSFDCVVTDGLD